MWWNTTQRTAIVVAAGISCGFGATTRTAGQCDPVAQLETTSNNGNTEYAVAVFVHDDRAIVGEPGNDAVSGNTGAAYVYERNAGGPDAWGEVAMLTPSLGVFNENLGFSVGLSGDLAIAGASGGGGLGSAYVFARNQGGPDAWGEVIRLSAFDGTPGDLFGVSVAIDGDVAVVGANQADVVATNAGAAYLFARNQGGLDAWGFVAQLIGSDTDVSHQFGVSVAISGDVVVVGARFAGASGEGIAYVFSRDEGGPDAWGEVARLTEPGAQGNDRFGEAVAIDGDIIAVGADLDDPVIANSGGAYVFARNQGGPDAWGLVKQIVGAAAIGSDRFGHSVSIRNDLLVVGAWGDDDTFGESGSAYLFARHRGGTDNWGEAGQFVAAGLGEDDQFGKAVATDRDVVLIGKPTSVNTPTPGTAHFYELLDCNGNGVADACDISEATSLDDDGNGIPDECELIGSVRTHRTISDTRGRFPAPLEDDHGLGQSVAGLDDLDGDGVPDLAVGGNGDAAQRGAVWIMHLNTDGSVKTHQKISDTDGGFGGTLDDGDLFGTSLARLGDLDGNGTIEVAVGARRDDDGGAGASADRGAVWILSLNPDGTVAGHQKISDTEGGFAGTLVDGDHFGRGVATLGGRRRSGRSGRRRQS